MIARIRAATPADAAILAAAGARMFAETFAADNRPEDLAAYLAHAFGPSQQAAELADPARLCLVAEAGEEVAGYVMLQRTPDGGGPEGVPRAPPSRSSASTWARSGTATGSPGG